MKKIVFLLAFALFAVSAGYAQEKGMTSRIGTRFDFALNQKGVTSVGLSFAPGYAFNSRLFLSAQFDGVYALWRNSTNWNAESVGTYRGNITLGPSIGYNIMKDNENGRGIIDVTASVGHSLLIRQWRYVYYDLGFSWSTPAHDEPRKYEYRSFVGIGLRYNDSYRTTIDDHLNFYVQIGFRFN